MGEDLDAIGHLSRSVFNQVGVTPEADVYVCGPPRFMADMKEALATLGVAPERIHVQIKGNWPSCRFFFSRLLEASICPGPHLNRIDFRAQLVPEGATVPVSPALFELRFRRHADLPGRLR
jgi:NAD(P)H-flavin reductase